MKFLFLSKEGDGLSVAQRVAQEGHKALMYIQDAKYRTAGDGIVERVASWRPHVASCDVVVCDMVGFGYLEDTFKKFNKPVFGCSKMMDIAELDRAKGMDMFNRVGINTPFTRTYDNPKDAIELAEMFEDGFVIKPHNNASTASTMMVEHKELFEWALSKYDDTITVQSIVKGIEVSTEGWFNGRSFITPFNHTFEEKKFLPDAGVHTGCMGNVVINVGAGNKLVDETVRKLEKSLKKINYRGPIDVNCIVTEDNVYALEFTSRLGYDAIEAFMEGLREPVSDVIFEIATGIKKEINLGKDPMIAVRLSKSPYPHAKPLESDFGMPILGITKENEKHIFLTDVFKENDKYFYAASDGVVAKVTAHAASFDILRSRVYNTINNINFIDKQFRNDIGVRVSEDIKKLKLWGWL